MALRPLHLSYGVQLQHQQFNPSAFLEFRRGLQKATELCGGRMPIASGCTGSGIEFHVVHELSELWSREYDVWLEMPHVFICEASQPVQAHLLSQVLTDMRQGNEPKPLFLTSSQL